jgi:hypothetical protein
MTAQNLLAESSVVNRIKNVRRNIILIVMDFGGFILQVFCVVLINVS